MTRKQPPSKRVKLNTEYEQDSPDQPEASNNPTPSTSNIRTIRTRFSTRIRSLTIAGRARILQTLRRSARIRNRSSGINNSNSTNESNTAADMEKTSPVQTVQEMNDIQVEESTKISNGKGKRKAEEIEEDEPVSKSSKSSSLDEEEYEKFLRSQLANPQTIQEHLEAEESLWSRPGYERAAISASSSRSSLMFGGSQETLLTRPSTAASAGRASTVVMEGNLPSQYAAEINQRMNEVQEIMRNLDSEQIGQENSTLEETDEMRIRVLGHSSEPLSPNSSLRSVASQTQYLLDDQASVSEQSQSPEDPDSILERDPEFYNIHQE